MSDKNKQVDILIAGAGYVGLATAVAIKAASPHLDITIVDAAPKDVWKNDSRASAIAVAAENMLSALGLWDDILPHAQPINKMIVTDSEVNDPIRPIFLNFDGKVEGDRPFAHMIPNLAMVKALRGKADELNIPILQSSPVTDFNKTDSKALITLANGDVIEAKLLIASSLLFLFIFSLSYSHISFFYIFCLSVTSPSLFLLHFSVSLFSLYFCSLLIDIISSLLFFLFFFLRLQNYIIISSL